MPTKTTKHQAALQAKEEEEARKGQESQEDGSKSEKLLEKYSEAEQEEDPLHPPSALPRHWPERIIYLTQPTFSDAVTAEQRARLASTSSSTDEIRIPAAEIRAPSPLVEIRVIEEGTGHPAAGQRGLFATQTLPPSTFLLLYQGHIHTNSLSDQDPTSDYDLHLSSALGLSIDSARAGNESRHINDYRGILERPNAEFRDCYVQVPSEKRVGGRKWELRVGVFVVGAGKRRKGGGVAPGEEVCVSYGKGFWEGRRTVALFRKDEGMLRMANLALDA